MGKRRRAIVLLSDDEEADEKYTKKANETSKAQQVIETERKRLVSLQVNSSSLPVNGEDSKKCRLAKTQGVHCPVGVPCMQPWAEKYAPREISDLAVHVKKVSEIREWLLSSLQSYDKLCGGGNVLLLSGPTGAGKTAVVHTLVNQFQEVELCEWDAPVPTLWKEHLHHVNSDAPYISKVDQFIEFLSKAKKYPGLPLMQQMPNEMIETPTLRTKTKKHKVLLIDDLPVVHGQELRSKLYHSLQLFVLSARFPTIFIITDFPQDEHGQVTGVLTTDVVETLDSGGAKRVSFNPITANAVKKVLKKILFAEKCTIPIESLSFIAESCGGDIRHAINCLEFMCSGLNLFSDNWDPGGDLLFADISKRRYTKESSQKNRKRPIQHAGSVAGHLSSIGCRDGSLSLFHALGKVLHNKRLTDIKQDAGENITNFSLKDDLQRYPLNMESPEVLISQAHADAASFLYFLQENMLEFIDEEGIEDVSVASSYFSDADCLLKRRKRTITDSSPASWVSDEIDLEHLAEAVAGSVAARGALFANTHPAKPRWLSLRAPGIRQADRLAKKKKAELSSKLLTAVMGNHNMFTHDVQAAELEPFLKFLHSSSFSTKGNTVPIKYQSITDELLSSILLLNDEDVFLDIMAKDLDVEMDSGIASKTNDDDDEIEEW